MIYNDRGHVKVVVTKQSSSQWPVGFIGWYDVVEERVFNEGYTDYWYHTLGVNCEYVEDKKEESMFTEAVTTTKIKEVIDGDGPNYTFVSVQQENENIVRIVVGAQWKHAVANCFSKEGLEELISELQKVADCLEAS